MHRCAPDACVRARLYRKSSGKRAASAWFSRLVWFSLVYWQVTCLVQRWDLREGATNVRTYVDHKRRIFARLASLPFCAHMLLK